MTFSFFHDRAFLREMFHIALLFTLAVTLMPRSVLGFYTNDPQVMEIGSRYLRIVGFSYIPVALATSYIAILRSVQVVRITVIATITALVFKTGLGYLLINGLQGFPPWECKARPSAHRLRLDPDADPAPYPCLRPKDSPCRQSPDVLLLRYGVLWPCTQNDMAGRDE